MQERNRKAVSPSAKPKTDSSDELTSLFDDGTKLPSVKPTPATQGTQGTLPTQGSQPIAPARDFQKVANSITREAVPARLFKGKSKQIYDYLYSRTRGAIVPTRTVQVTRREMMKGAGIGSDKTIRENLLHLRGVGLISWGGEIGAQDGNLYTVYLPEETPATQGTQGTQGTVGSPGYNLPEVPAVETTQGTQGLTADFQRASEIPNTSFKTNTKDDDEAMPLLRSRIGKAPKTEAVLLSLLDTLEARTDVSSPDALIAHVLSQKLSPRPKSAPQRPSEGQSSPPPVTQFSDEELAELRQIEADIRAELERKEK